MACLGRVPEEGEAWDIDGMRITAIETTTTQVSRIGIQSIEVDDVENSGEA